MKFSMKEIYHNLSDIELVTLLKEGDQRYFAVFTSRYEKYILSKCRSYVKEKEVSEDLCQEVLIRVFIQLPKFRGEAKLTTWLYTIVHNTCIDYLRKNKNKKKIREVITQKIIEDIGEITDFDEELPQEKTEEVLDELLEQMTPEEKLILLLKYKEKHHIKDIGLSLGISESALKMRLKRAKDRLNKLYLMKLKEKKKNSNS